MAEVVYNYSQAGIPVETMWTDIDYMDRRLIFTTDPERYPVEKLRALVSYLHENDQHYIVMVDPAAGYQDNYPPLDRAIEDNVLLLRQNGSAFLGVVWPGVTVFPDWFAENATDYWNNEFDLFFNPEDGIDIDGLWIDMNEPSSFGCVFPCVSHSMFSAEDRTDPNRITPTNKPRDFHQSHRQSVKIPAAFLVSLANFRLPRMAAVILLLDPEASKLATTILFLGARPSTAFTIPSAASQTATNLASQTVTTSIPNTPFTTLPPTGMTGLPTKVVSPTRQSSQTLFRRMVLSSTTLISCTVTRWESPHTTPCSPAAPTSALSLSPAVPSLARAAK